MKSQRIKDSKNKQKFDLSRSIQNLTYLLPSSNEHVANSLSNIARENQIEKYEHVFQTQNDQEISKPFLKTQHNRNKIPKNSLSYRSPYTNRFYPPIQDASFPPPLIRSIEEKGMILFSEYSKLYYGQCISNFFVEENEEELNFAFYLQKRYDDEEWKGIWNSTSITEIKGDPTKSISYKITTSVIYEITCSEKSIQSFTLHGNLKKTKTDNKKISPECQVDDFHLITVGKLVQENETFLRQQIESVFMRKTEDIISKTRIAQSNEVLDARRQQAKEIMKENQLASKQ